MSAVGLALGGLAVLAGGAVLFLSRRARGRLLGLASMAVGALLALVSVAPRVPGAVPAAAVSALTLVGLVLVAHRLERLGRQADRDLRPPADLDLDPDPAR